MEPIADCLPPPASPPQRLLSLDALRGFAMLWLIGGREFVLSLVGILHLHGASLYCLPPGLYDALETQLTHPIWLGFRAWDMVMPLFLFTVGAAIPLSLGRYADGTKSLKPVYRKIARRVVVLWALGIVYQLLRSDPYDHLELYSNALQAIAVGYLVASLATLHLPVVGRCVLLAVLLLGYDALMSYVPFGGHPGGTLEKKVNFALFVDELALGIFRRDHHFAWIVPSLGFSATVLLGTLAGQLLKGRLAAPRRLGLLTAIGLACLTAGWFWSYRLPLNRYLWSSSMVLWAGGWSFLLLALFHFAIDVRGFKRWAFPILVIGSNALLAYMIDPLVDRTTDFTAQVLLVDYHKHYAELLSSSVELGLIWMILWCLYRRRIFFRV